jgi:hypothetical protein
MNTFYLAIGFIAVMSVLLVYGSLYLLNASSMDTNPSSCSMRAFLVGVVAWARRGFNPLPADELARLPEYAASSVLTLVSGLVLIGTLVVLMPALSSNLGRLAWVLLLGTAGVYGAWRCITAVHSFYRLRCAEGQLILSKRAAALIN